MSFAEDLALVAGTLNLALAILFLVLAKAPGWGRVSRLMAAIALTAGLYNALSRLYSVPGYADWVYLAAARLTYLVAALHCVAWLIYAFGGRRPTARAMPVPIRWIAVLGLAVSVFFAVTGLHLTPVVSVVDVRWAGVTYRFPGTTTAGGFYGLLMPVILCLVFVRLAHRYRRGERHLRWLLIGFAIYFVCAVDEALVAYRVFAFLSLLDAGLLFVVLPLAVLAVYRIIAGARRLRDLSDRLADQVRQRTRERDRAQEALREAERLATLGQIAAGVGHEIANPLTYLQLSLSEIASHLGAADAPDPARNALASAQDGARRIQDVVEGLRSYSRGEEKRAPLDPRQAIQAALKIATPHLRHVAPLQMELGDVPLVLADEPRLVQVLVNLLVNAAQAVSPEAVEKGIVVSTATGPAGEALVTVADTGRGIAPEHLRRLGEPYFTTRAGEGGLGLGLFVTRGIVDAHGGRLEFRSEAGHGTEVRITLPGLPADAEVKAPSPSLDQPTGIPSIPTLNASPDARCMRVLLVDDEPLVAKLLQRSLQRRWDVTTAASGAHALELLREKKYDAMVCDLMMPNLSGMELAEVVGRQNPELRARTVFLTGGAVTASAQSFLARPDVRYLQKPVSIAVLNDVLLDLVKDPAVDNSGRHSA
jgi:signal transduction histidine kinase/ActR/RegA family two-component response regulator